MCLLNTAEVDLGKMTLSFFLSLSSLLFTTSSLSLSSSECSNGVCLADEFLEETMLASFETTSPANEFLRTDGESSIDPARLLLLSIDEEGIMMFPSPSRINSSRWLFPSLSYFESFMDNSESVTSVNCCLCVSKCNHFGPKFEMINIPTGAVNMIENTAVVKISLPHLTHSS